MKIRSLELITDSKLITANTKEFSIREKPENNDVYWRAKCFDGCSAGTLLTS